MVPVTALSGKKGLRAPSRFSPVGAVFLLAGLALCSRTDNVIRAWDAQVHINAAYFAKIEQCEQPPGLLLLVPHDVQEPDVQLCEGELLASACPIATIPPSCFILYFKPAPAPDVDQKPKL